MRSIRADLVTCDLSVNTINIHKQKTARVLFFVCGILAYMKKNLLYIITIVILCVGVLIFSKKEVKQTPAMRENGFNLIRSDVGVENHVQDVSGIAFTMTYPENTTISEVYNTYRIQNYTTKDPLYRLKPNEFFLDVIVYDHSKNKYMEQSCESMLVTKEKFTKNTPDGSVSFYNGTVF